MLNTYKDVKTPYMLNPETHGDVAGLKTETRKLSSLQIEKAIWDSYLLAPRVWSDSVE